jgi:hypothetical protein
MFWRPWSPLYSITLSSPTIKKLFMQPVINCYNTRIVVYSVFCTDMGGTTSVT